MSSSQGISTISFCARKILSDGQIRHLFGIKLRVDCIFWKQVRVLMYGMILMLSILYLWLEPLVFLVPIKAGYHINFIPPLRHLHVMMGHIIPNGLLLTKKGI